MNKKWLEIQFPYYSPDGATGSTGNDNRGSEGDVDVLAEGEDNTDDKIDDKSDDNDDNEDSKDDKKREQKTETNRRRDKTDSKDDEGESDKKNEEKDEEETFGEEFDEAEDDTKDEDYEKSTKEDDEIEEVENEFTVRALKKEFPNIFKKFPEVKDAIFREREFTKFFGSIDEAEEASNKARYLDEVSQDLFEGKSENLLKALKKNSEKSLEIFSFGFLPELYKTDKELYHQVTDHALNQMLHVVNSNALKNGNKNLATAVKYISQFVFGEPELPELKERPVAPKKTEAELKLEEREKAHEQQKYSEFEDSVHSRTRSKLENIVKEGFNDENMTDFVKDAITDKIIDKVGVIIAKDKFFQSQLASMWKKAVREGYTSEAKSRIISAYLARAKKIVPSVRAEVRKSASSRHSNNNENNNDTGKRQGTSTGSGKRHSTLPSDPKKIPASMSDEDILAAD